MYSTFLTLLIICCLYLCFAKIEQDVTSLKIGCLAPLCDQKTSFYNHRTQLLEIFVPPLSLTERVEGCKMCVSLEDVPSVHCYADEHGRVQVNMTNSEFVEKGMENWMYGERVVMVRRSKHCPDGSVIMHDRADRHYIMSIPAGQEESSREVLPAHLTAYVRQSTPPYGSILSRRFLLQYHANEVAKEQASFVNFDVQGIYQGELDPLGSEVSTSGNPNGWVQRGAGMVGEEEDRDDLDMESGGQVEPASWFFTLQPALKQAFLDIGGLSYPSFGYLEFVLERYQILKGRVFDLLGGSSGKAERGREETVVTTRPSTEGKAEGAGEEVTVCLFSSHNMDGQKRIWLSQIEQLPLPPYSPGVKVNPTHGNIGDKPLKFVVLIGKDKPCRENPGLKHPSSSSSSQLLLLLLLLLPLPLPLLLLLLLLLLVVLVVVVGVVRRLRILLCSRLNKDGPTMTSLAVALSVNKFKSSLTLGIPK